MADKTTIKNWFLTNLVPTQAQFWATWDSFWHKDEKIPITAIEGIEEILAEKADAEALANHMIDESAHAKLFEKTKIYAPGQLQVFKRNENENEAVAEPNDYCKGIVENIYIEGLYNGGDIALLTSFTIFNQQDFNI